LFHDLDVFRIGHGVFLHSDGERERILSSSSLPRTSLLTLTL
jgi:hypothetical protein